MAGLEENWRLYYDKERNQTLLENTQEPYLIDSNRNFVLKFNNTNSQIECDLGQVKIFSTSTDIFITQNSDTFFSKDNY